MGEKKNKYCTTHHKVVRNHLRFPLVLLNQLCNKVPSLCFLDMVWFIKLYPSGASSVQVRP